MPTIVLTVAPRPHSVLPCLAPVDRAQAQHDATILESGRPAWMVERCPSFQRVIAAHIVIDARRQSGKIRAQQIAFRGMQIATGRIATQRPPIAAERFPGRQAERELEQDRNAGNIERLHCRQVAAPERGVACGQGIGRQRQFDRRRARIAPKRIGLIGPIQPAGTGRVPVEAVLAAVVIFEERGIRQLKPLICLVAGARKRAHLREVRIA